MFIPFIVTSRFHCAFGEDLRRQRLPSENPRGPLVTFYNPRSSNLALASPLLSHCPSMSEFELSIVFNPSLQIQFPYPIEPITQVKPIETANSAVDPPLRSSAYPNRIETDRCICAHCTAALNYSPPSRAGFRPHVLVGPVSFGGLLSGAVTLLVSIHTAICFAVNPGVLAACLVSEENPFSNGTTTNCLFIVLHICYLTSCL